MYAGTPRETISAYLDPTADAADPVKRDSAVKIVSMRASAGEVASGGTITVMLEGTVQPYWTGTREALMLRVTSVESGATVFSTNTALCGLALPYAGEFTLEVDLQLNVPANVYTVQSLVWDTLTSREVHPGLRTQLRVLESTAFAGSVQMNPRLRLRAGIERAAPLGDAAPVA